MIFINQEMPEINGIQAVNEIKGLQKEKRYEAGWLYNTFFKRGFDKIYDLRIGSMYFETYFNCHDQRSIVYETNKSEFSL